MTLAALPQGRDPGSHWTGGWEGPRAGLNAMGKTKISMLLPGIKPWLFSL